MTVKIGCIVEGQGDVVTVPLLIRRIAAELYPELALDIPRPIRVHRNQVVQPNNKRNIVYYTNFTDGMEE